MEPSAHGKSIGFLEYVELSKLKPGPMFSKFL